MKTNAAKILMLISVACLSATWICAQPESAEKISPRVTEITGDVTGVKFSPSGKWVIIQMDTGFYLFPFARLDEAITNLENSDDLWTEGQAKDFLPVSEKVVFAPRRGLYTLDPQTRKTEPIFQMTAEDEEKGNYLTDAEMIAVSDDLIVSGDGDYDNGMGKGNILFFDVKLRRAARRARIDGFNEAQLSPNKKYVLYQHGGAFASHTDYYDINRNVNYSIAKRFDFKRHFPKHERTSVYPVAWVAPDKFVARVYEELPEQYESDSGVNPEDVPRWLILCDAASGKLVWKKQLSSDAPFYLNQTSPIKAFFETNEGIYEISLTGGSLRKLSNIKGTGFVVSPDKESMIYLDEDRVIRSRIDGSNRETIFELPAGWSRTERGVRVLSSSPDGKRLFVFGTNRLLIVKVEN